MCQRREDVFVSMKEKGAVEEAAPVSEEAFNSLRPISKPPKNWREKKEHKSLQTKKKGLPIPEGVSFLFYGRPTPESSEKAGDRGHQGVMTVAMRIAGPGVLHLAFAFCNSGDPRKKILPDRFSKVEGRNRALERLFDDPMVIPYLYEPRRIAEYVAGAVATHEFGRLSQYGVQIPRGFDSFVPHWTKNLPQMVKAQKDTQKRRRPPMSHVLDAMANCLVPLLSSKHPPGGVRIRLISNPRQLGKSFFSLRDL